MAWESRRVARFEGSLNTVSVPDAEVLGTWCLHAAGDLPRVGGGVAEVRDTVLGSMCVRKTLGGGGFSASEDADQECSCLDDNRIGRQQLAYGHWQPVGQC